MRSRRCATVSIALRRIHGSSRGSRRLPRVVVRRSRRDAGRADGDRRPHAEGNPCAPADRGIRASSWLAGSLICLFCFMRLAWEWHELLLHLAPAKADSKESVMKRDGTRTRHWRPRMTLACGAARAQSARTERGEGLLAPRWPHEAVLAAGRTCARVRSWAHESATRKATRWARSKSW